MAPPNWFIALPLDADDLPAGELDALPAGTRRFHPADLHVTVAFLGPVDCATALQARELVDWSGQPPMRVATSARATFGSPARPSALGLEFNDPDGKLTAFIGTWRDHLLAAADRPPERREVRPHVTLGRPPRRGSDSIALRDWLAASPAPAPVLLDRIALYTRAEADAGHRFVTCRECRLGDAA